MKLRLPRLRRALVLGCGICLVVVGTSYARALLAPNSPGWDLRTAEWVRDNHAGWALDFAEWVWFSVHKPTGVELESTRLSAFPEPFARQRASAARSPAEPAPIAVLFDKPVHDEGVWRGIGSTVNGVPALRCAFFRPDTERPEVSVGVARFTPELTRFVLVPGTRDPGGVWRWHGTIPEDQREGLLSAFNAGYRLRGNDAQGGIYVEGKLARPLVDGAASLVIDKDGAPDIVEWTPDRKLSPEVGAVRQNLALIVTDGHVRSDLARNAGNVMWRTGLGIASDGALIYLAGHGLTLGTLAIALEHAGAVRAMPLDVHQQWPSFNVFQPKTPADHELLATKLLTDMRHPARRYLTPDDRDFVAAFVR